MRGFVALSLVLGLGLACSPAHAQEPEALRKELEQLRKQMDALSERLQRLEAQPQLAAQPTPGQAPAASPPSVAELTRPREPFSLYERRGAGQLLFDVGVVGDLVGNLTQRNVDKANAGTFAGRENRFFPREVEINLFGRIDPYAEGVVRFEFAEEFENRQRTTETKLAEAYLTLLTLPSGTKLSIGRLPVRFGLLSHLHREALPQPDSPQVLLRILGEEQFRETGAELSWVAPLPFYLEALVGAFNGDNDTAFGRGSLKEPLVTGRLRTFVELDDFGAIQLGVSGANGETPERRRSTLAGFDLKYKLTPEGWRHPLLTLAGEALFSDRRVNVVNAAGAGETRVRERFGWYAYGEVQPWQRWAGGARYDWTEFPVVRGHEWAVEPYLSFLPSEFLRFRLAYKHTERDRRESVVENQGSARIVDEILFQTTFFLGAHQPHPF